jgi:adenylate cyclase
MTQASTVYRFDGFVLDLARGTLSRAGREIPLRRRSFELLRLMAGNSGRLLNRDAINAVVWPDTLTTDENIAQCVREVRAAIGDDARAVLRTMPRRGYLFTATVEEGSSPSSISSPQMEPGPSGPSVTVSSFQCAGHGITLEGFAHGLADEVRAAFSNLTPLTVVESGALEPAGGVGVPGRDACYVLMGGIGRSKQDFNVTLRLVDRFDWAQTWAGRYDQRRAARDAGIGGLAARIVCDVAHHVEARILARAWSAPSPEPTPYELLVRGREHLWRGPREELSVAEDLFAHAIALDPCWAVAHVELARVCYNDLTWRLRPISPDLALGKGFDHVERALGLNASLPDAYEVVSRLHLRAREFPDALRWAEHAMALNPYDSSIRAAIANVLSYTGHSDEALDHLVEARALDPRYPPVLDYYTGRALVHVGRHEEALIWLNRASRRAPHIGTWGGYRAAALAHLGRFQEIRDALPRLALPGGHTSINMLVRQDSYRDSPELDVLVSGLRIAGFPEYASELC